MNNHYLNNSYLEKAILLFQETRVYKNKYDEIIIRLRKTPDKRARKPNGKGLVTLNECRAERIRLQTEFIELQKILADSFLMLSDQLAKYRKFNHIDPEDAIQEGAMICLEKMGRFDPRYGKAFNYLTTCILNHYKQLYRTAKHYNEFKKKYHDHLYTKLENTIANKLRDKKFFKFASFETEGSYSDE